MSSSESKMSFPPTPASKRSSDTSSVPTDLTVSSSDKSKEPNKGAKSKGLEDEIKLLKVELRRKDALLEVTKAECAEKVRAAEQLAQEAINAKKQSDDSTKLRTELQTAEMARIQAAISEQLREVTSRQQQLEDINKKLREKADVAKVRLESFKLDPSRYSELMSRKVEEMSIYEFCELIIYRHIIPERELNARLENNNRELNNKLSEIVHDVGKLEALLQAQKRENQALTTVLSNKNKELEKIRDNIHQIDALNLGLQEKVRGNERIKEDFQEQLDRREAEFKELLGRKEKEINLYRKRVEDMSQDFKLYSTENQNLTQTLTALRQEFDKIRFKFDTMEQRSEQGLSTISSFTKRMQEKQLELLEELSTSIFQNNLDQKYRDQYLITIRQLVNEQIRTQQYITKISSERDLLQSDVNQLTNQTNKLQILCTELKLLVTKEEEKSSVYKKEIDNLNRELRGCNQDLLEMRESRGTVNVDVKNTKEYKMLLKDLKLLLSHRDEIKDMRELIVKLQQES